MGSVWNAVFFNADKDLNPDPASGLDRVKDPYPAGIITMVRILDGS